ncbi:MAG: ABC transporter permease subunit, partial [Clostridia bacterium]
GTRYKKLVQNVTYMPHFISTVVMVGILIRFFNPSFGVISKLIQALGGTNRDLMGIAGALPHLYVWSDIWQNAGWNTILFLAALTAVDPQLHEAAIVDGASRMQRVRHIDIPSIIPTSSSV